MKISQLVIVMLLVSGVVVGMYGFARSLADTQHYNIPLNTSYQDTYTKLDELQNITNATQDKVKTITSREDAGFFTGTWDAFQVTKEVTFGSAKVTLTSLSLGTTLLTDFIEDMGFGAEAAHVGAIVVSILTILVISAVIFLLVKRRW